MRFVAVILVADIAVLQHKQEFSLGYMQVRSRRVRADDLFHALTTYQKSAPRLVVMPIIKQRADGFRTDVFSALVQMGIDICRGGQVGVTDEGRYIQQRHILIDEDAGEGVAQIVKANLAQTVLPDKIGEPLRDPIRAYQPAELIDADIIVVFAVVAALEHSAVQVLLFPFLAQHFIHRVRRGSVRRLDLFFISSTGSTMTLPFSLYSMILVSSSMVFFSQSTRDHRAPNASLRRSPKPPASMTAG